MKVTPLLSVFAITTVVVAIVSCTHVATSSTAAQSVSEIRNAENAARPEIAQIPLPTKSKYLTVHRRLNWENPFVTVQEDTLLLRVTVADANPSPMGQGGYLRPTGARRHDLTIRLNELPKALAALPDTAWPYGRVVAVEESGSTPATRPKVRRNVEQTIQILSELGIVINEWAEPNSQGNN